MPATDPFAQEAWGCYQSDDLAHFEYGTCPEFTEVGVANARLSRGMFFLFN